MAGAVPGLSRKPGECAQAPRVGGCEEGDGVAARGCVCVGGVALGVCVGGVALGVCGCVLGAWPPGCVCGCVLGGVAPGGDVCVSWGASPWPHSQGETDYSLSPTFFLRCRSPITTISN